MKGSRPNDPDELADRFVRLTDDLAYCPHILSQEQNGTYLNGLASRSHLAIYKNKKEKRNRFASFWTTELPLVLARHRRTYCFAFFSFLSFSWWAGCRPPRTMVSSA